MMEKKKSVRSKTDDVMILVMKLGAMSSRINQLLEDHVSASDASGPMFAINYIALSIDNVVGAFELGVNKNLQPGEEGTAEALYSDLKILKDVRDANKFNSESLNRDIDNVIMYGEKVIDAVNKGITGDEFSEAGILLLKSTMILLNDTFMFMRPQLPIDVKDDLGISKIMKGISING